MKYTLDEIIRIMLDDKTVRFSEVDEKRQCYVQRKGDQIVWLGEEQEGQPLILEGINDLWELYEEEYPRTFMEICKIIQDSDCGIEVKVDHPELREIEFDYLDYYIEIIAGFLSPSGLAEVFTTGKWYYREAC